MERKPDCWISVYPCRSPIQHIYGQIQKSEQVSTLMADRERWIYRLRIYLKPQKATP